MNEKEFDSLFEKAYEEKLPVFENHINIAVVGKVSAGKSSLLNAILGYDRLNAIAKVGAHSGVTTKITSYKLDTKVLIIDCPGLDDVRKENSDETTNFLESIDLGLFVVTGSADVTQKDNYEELKKHSNKVIVILNKIDEWDDLEESAYEAVRQQWQSILGANIVFGTCTKGYDPKTRQGAPMDIRGIEEVKNEIFAFLEKEGKAILLARHLKDKKKFAVGIIGSALLAVAVEAFIPGSAAYITATQATSITALHYLYTGKTLSKTNSFSLIGTFASESIGTTLFLWSKSLLPPTGIVDIVAAGVAMVVTFAMLAAVKWVLENNYSLEQIDKLTEAFVHFKVAGDDLKKTSLDDLKDKESVINLIARLLSTTWKPN